MLTLPPVDWQFAVASLVAAAWGGVARYFMDLRRNSHRFNLLVFLARITVSCFAGILGGIAAASLGAGAWVIMGVCGICGAVGEGIIVAAVEWISRQSSHYLNVDIKDDNDKHP